LSLTISSAVFISSSFCDYLPKNQVFTTGDETVELINGSTFQLISYTYKIKIRVNKIFSIC